MLAPTLDAIPGIRKGRGRPRRRPVKLHADKGYDHKRCRHECRARSIMPRIARRGIETSQKLGRHRWVVERTFAWLAQFRRLAIRYERHADIYAAFTKLACAIICSRQNLRAEAGREIFVLERGAECSRCRGQGRAFAKVQRAGETRGSPPEGEKARPADPAGFVPGSKWAPLSCRHPRMDQALTGPDSRTFSASSQLRIAGVRPPLA